MRLRGIAPDYDQTLRQYLLLKFGRSLFLLLLLQAAFAAGTPPPSTFNPGFGYLPAEPIRAGGFNKAQSGFSQSVLAQASLSQAPSSQLNASHFRPPTFPYFKRGVEAFRKQQFDEALFLFESALALGRESPLLLFNLGATHFKLRHYALAIAYFERLEASQLSAVAIYNQALCWEALGDNAVAQALFRRAAAADNDKIRFLARQKIPANEPRLVPKQSPVDSQKSFARALVEVLRGVDDNVTLIDGSESIEGEALASQEQDGYWQLYGAAELPLTVGATLNASALSMAFDEFSEFDFDELIVGGQYRWRFTRWWAKVSLSFHQSSLGTSKYQEGLRLKGAAYTYWGGKLIRGNYEYKQLEARDAVFLPSQGHRHRLRLGIQPIEGFWLSYQLERNERNNTATRSYSPSRFTLSMRYQSAWAQGWAGFAGLNYRDSNYSSVADFKRKETRWRVGLGVQKQLWRGAHAELGLAHVAVDSNWALGGYEQNTLSLSVHHAFERTP